MSLCGGRRPGSKCERAQRLCFCTLACVTPTTRLTCRHSPNIFIVQSVPTSTAKHGALHDCWLCAIEYEGARTGAGLPSIGPSCTQRRPGLSASRCTNWMVPPGCCAAPQNSAREPAPLPAQAISNPPTHAARRKRTGARFGLACIGCVVVFGIWSSVLVRARLVWTDLQRAGGETVVAKSGCVGTTKELARAGGCSRTISAPDNCGPAPVRTSSYRPLRSHRCSCSPPPPHTVPEPEPEPEPEPGLWVPEPELVPEQFVRCHSKDVTCESPRLADLNFFRGGAAEVYERSGYKSSAPLGFSCPSLRLLSPRARRGAPMGRQQVAKCTRSIKL